MEQRSLELKYSEELFEEILSEDQLRIAYKAVRSNKGSPGIDKVSVEQYGENLDENLRELIEEVKNWNYRPMPVRRVRIPKPGSDKERLLGIPCVKDRVLQYSLKMSLEKIFEEKFSENSYGFRPARNQKQAVIKAKELVNSGKDWIVDIDLERFFDTISHDRLIHLLGLEIKDKRILRLIGITLRSGILDKGELIENEEGAVQGSPLSPLLSNVVLHELDAELEKRELSFCRFADDCNIFVSSRKAAERVLASISKFIEKKLKLKVNLQKSKVAPSAKVKFLGMTIACTMMLISKVSMARAMEKVKELTPRRSHLSLERQIDKINQWYVGWSGYYSMTETPSQLQSIEAHIRRRLRAQLVRNQKRRRHLDRKLIQQGVRAGLAHKTAYSNHGVWKLSHTAATEQAWSKSWFRQMGLKIASQAVKSHWKSLTVWVKLC